ncbi:right-handed parallel beta-helix repeat-containing protein [Terriglobus saanensis]|uniref:Periplasmic copper-binding protein NosD beta helix domain-containing protein n=1 Tax=Terriglobus saanensis (strain ATCC BAA-1853 / DSM 23119 / SP1PR4) TaxID=401053 RepID=E8V6N1_TERSS|nr:right-handed parallel beta-helix repeat-containing protein [Terriglobus saanensis]ADV82770.1 hypothetical protein AciPR4_1966 [Terriglobus saanensis SP1PR4]
MMPKVPTTTQSRAKQIVLGILLVAGFAVAPCNAAQYFVDATHGSDRGTGLSPNAAWQHLSSVNRFAHSRGFRPGDEILLKSGERWREQMELTGAPGMNGGSDQHPLRIGSYGTGELPTIDGADSASGWKSAGKGVYQIPMKDPVFKVFVDGDDHPTHALTSQLNFAGGWAPGSTYRMWDFIQNQGKTFLAMQDITTTNRILPSEWYRIGSLPPEQMVSGLENVSRVPGSWFYDARQQALFVHLADGGDPSSHSMQIVHRTYGVFLQGCSHVVIDGVRIIHAAKSGILAAVNPGGGAVGNEYNTVRNSVFWNLGDGTTDWIPSISMSGEGAVFVAAGTAAPTNPALRGWTIQDNAVGEIDSDRFLNYERNGLSITGTADLVLKQNYVSTLNSLGISVFTIHGPQCTTPTIQGNFLTMNDGNIRVSGCIKPVIDSNTITYSYGYGVQIGGNSSSATITHNTIHHIARIGNENAYNGLDCNGGAPDGTLAYNSIAAVWGAEATFEVGCSRWSIHDNVFDSSNNVKGGGLTFYIRQDSIPGLKFENNIYRLNSGTKQQFNYGAGVPGSRPFHDFDWWKQNVETSALQCVAGKDDRRCSFASTAPYSLPTEGFTAVPAVRRFMSTAPRDNWQP